MLKQRFIDKVVIITGGGTGIGKACAMCFAQEGAKVVIAGRREKPLVETVKEIQKNGGTADFIITDVSKSFEVNQLVDKTVEKFGVLDVFVANASINKPAPILETTDEDINRLVDINIKGNYYQLRKSLEQMSKQKHGNIVAMSSMSGLLGHPNMSLYCSTKAAICNMVRSLALEYAEKNIRINAVCPGTIETPMVFDFAATTVDPKKTVQAFTESEPIKRLGTPEETANVVLFLASEEASFVTGAMYTVDGGFTAGKA
ncbi:SDR family NAD(P)-dependent oxidoreductase [Atribacter laminatus]|jgi:NAD(P)-dependent dehydrogenase (short-subunit alcohol dehydrogenase family)|uniref:Dihydroanticapsin 7-dehydrogenase n=1 Tax=Atribacter laminatus TaxID=2847778 RepID=A0A7T1AKA3_ATRLM|nr:SDR family oxidoreductase [Atribacter laminatus]QPM67489.1 Dihydroanticapsin 7-dehydrogenase [Atribacter laminatus]